MTADLDPIADAVFATCETCGQRLLVSPDAARFLGHNDDGSHSFEGFGEEDATVIDKPVTTDD